MNVRDMELYDRWKKSKSPSDMDALIDSMHGLIYNQAAKYISGAVPMPSLIIKGRTLAAEAIESWDPKGNSKLSSWVATYLNKLGRFYSQNTLLHVSEDMFNTGTRYFNEKNTMEVDLGREPTVVEIADSLGIPSNKVLQLERTFSPIYNDNIISTSSYLDVPVSDKHDLLYAYEQLNEEEQRLFKMKTGWPGGKARGLSYISSRTGMSRATISRRLEDIARKIRLTLGIE